MKLHRLVLTNYRGISRREIEFPDRGVVVISGANEIGKSSMIEALDLLFAAKDRSSKKEVKLVKPTHADVGAEISAEISTGPYRFVYRKRFHKRAETELTVLAPQREQLTGDEAHERALALLEQTVDMDLWQAQRVWQSASTAAVDLSGSDALARALDVAAGEAATMSGAEPLLIDRIDEEYGRYFTATGRPTGEWAAATKRLQAAEAEVAECAAAVGEVDDAVRRHAALTEQLAELTAERTALAGESTAARKAAEAVAVLRRQVDEAGVIAKAAEDTRTASLAAVTERRRLRADIDERRTAIVELEATVAAAVGEEAGAREVDEAAEQAADKARAAVEEHHARVDAARAVAQRLSDRDEADRLAGRLAKIDAALRELTAVETELAGITVTDSSMRVVDTAALAVERAAGQAELASARIELEAFTEVEVRVGDEPVRLTAGQAWSANATSPTEITVPGLLTARVVPGTPAVQTQARLDAANAELSAALQAAGAPDVATARTLHDRRRELAQTRATLRATVEALTGDDTAEHLRARLAELRDGQPDAEGLFDLEGPADAASARAALAAAVAAHQRAIGECETHRKVAVAASAKLGQKATRLGVVREKLAAAQAELNIATERLAAARAVIADDALSVSAEADGEVAARAAARAAQLREELARCAPDAVEATLDDVTRRERALQARHEDTAETLREVTAALKVYGTEGRQGQLDSAHAEREHAESDYLRVHRRARAVELLRSVMSRHRAATRERYVDPFRREVERLGRLVFGDSFEVEIDSDLRICNRTLAGRTVPYESLSGGAKEQLGIVARLAGAALVAKEDSVPVIIDDALGFTDPDRLTKMGAVFDVIGGAGQVIVLTCSPQRYAAVPDAHHIELTV
ncbi:AAA family ATPase [Mycolicibacterium baixiangningiae]|uniref:AAA family ATPase n=1 Tax=Mycolicibacterium baixiangningiae TaxID=2761578 RepID=UPI0018679AC3|nr:AAA family ATPase [Mycolicibacterium baixiangningiae]